MKRIERIYNITIPEEQTILALPSDKDYPMRDYIKATEWLQECANEGWLWQGQITRDWFADGTTVTERFDVFHRIPTKEDT